MRTSQSRGIGALVIGTVLGLLAVGWVTFGGGETANGGNDNRTVTETSAGRSEPARPSPTAPAPDDPVDALVYDMYGAPYRTEGEPWGAHEAPPLGLNPDFEWYDGARSGLWAGTPGTGHAITPWGQLFEAEPGTRTHDARLHVRNPAVFFLMADGTWERVRPSLDDPEMEGAWWDGEFRSVDSSPTRAEPDGGYSVPLWPLTEPDRVTWHFWWDGWFPRETIPADAVGLYVEAELRLIPDSDERVVVYDGAFGTYMQTQDLTADDFGGPALEGCNELLVLTRPDVIAQLHDDFLEVGVDVVETNTFGAFAIPLAEYGLADRTHEINLAAARIAREVADRFSTPDRPRFVAGSIGPGTKFPSLGQIRFAELRDAYEVQCRGLLDGGVDLLLIETQFDLLGAKAAMIGRPAGHGRPPAVEVPLQVQVTIELTGRMLPGTEIGAASPPSTPWVPTSSASTAPPAPPR
jgi:hypothetical protein